MAKQHAPGFLKIVQDAKTRVRECTVDDVKRRLDAGERFTLIDVREESEYAAGHVPGALLMPMRAYGVDAYSVTGGTTAWQRSGRPVEVGS